jgi:hypothetical protein
MIYAYIYLYVCIYIYIYVYIYPFIYTYLYLYFINIYLYISFSADSVDGVKLSVSRESSVWFDEMYVGFDTLMGFVCPKTEKTGTVTSIPLQKVPLLFIID